MNQEIKSNKRVMETGDHFKNGASLKSLTSRGNIRFVNPLSLLMSVFMFYTCNDENTSSTVDGFTVTQQGTCLSFS